MADSTAYSSMFARLTQILVVLFALAASVRGTTAQSTEEAIAEQVKLYIEPLREWLPLELQFATEACELSEEQVSALRAAAQAEIDLIAKEAAAVPRRRQPENRGRRAAVVGGRAVALPAGLDVELANELTHSIVCRTLQEKWPAAWERFEAEREKLEGRRKQAAILIEVAVLDDSLLLSSGQRTQLCERLAQSATDAWRHPANVGSIVDPAVEGLQASLAGGPLATFTFQESELAKLLLPSQLATFKYLQRPWREEVVIAGDMAIAREAQRRAAAAPVPERIAAARLAAEARERALAKRQAQQAQQPAQAVAARRQAAAAMQPQVVRRGLPMDEQRRRLTRYIECRIDEIESACGLSLPQRDKLLLAGKLDIERLREQTLPPDAKLAAGQDVRIVHEVQVGGRDSALPLAIFSDETSYFQRALRGRLLDEQKQKLAEAERERREFQRRALVEAAVVGFERAAALTARQCGELSFVLNEALVDNDIEAAKNWRAECVRQIAELGQDKLGLVLSDIQQGAAKRHQAAIAQAARQFETQRATNAVQPPGAGGGGMF